MNELPPLTRDQRKVDVDHVKLLAIFHFIGAGLGLIGLVLLAGHFALMHSIFTNPKFLEAQKQSPPPAEILAVFKVLYLVVGVWWVISLVLNLISGLCLSFRKGRTFSLVVAVINCLHIPLGTVLGVFTLVVLIRSSVRELYEA